MGCDIHLFIEVRPNAKEQWESFGGEIDLNRDYVLFCILNKNMGRVESPNGFPEKGRAEYLGDAAQDSVGDGGNHSFSWLYTKECARALEIYYAGDHWKAIEFEAVIAAMQKFEQNGWDARIVFWFDN